MATRSAGRPVASDENRWQQVLDGAMRVFEQKGYKAATVQDVADEAGIVKGTLYYYIKAKEDLLYAIVDHVLQLLIPKLKEIEAFEGSAAEKLHVFVSRYTVHTIAHRQAIGIYLRDFDALPAKRRKKITEVTDIYNEFLSNLIRSGQKSGEFRADADAQVVAFSIFGMVNWLNQWYRPDGPMTPEQIAEDMANFAVHGVLAGA